MGSCVVAEDGKQQINLDPESLLSAFEAKLEESDKANSKSIELINLDQQGLGINNRHFFIQPGHTIYNPLFLFDRPLLI